MGVEKFVLPYLLILLSLGLCSTSSLSNDHLPNAYFQQETGYNLRDYPSYFGNVRSPHFGKNFNKNRKSLAAASVKTVNVLNSGAKGDGTTDDSKVIIYQINFSSPII